MEHEDGRSLRITVQPEVEVQVPEADDQIGGFIRDFIRGIVR